MLAKDRITVISHFSSASHLLSAFDALTSALGSNFTYLVLTPENQVDTITGLAISVSDRIKVVRLSRVDQLTEMVGKENPVLLMPSQAIFMICGLHSALDLLESKVDLDAVGGILIDRERKANTFGFVIHNTTNQNLELLVEIEVLNTRWIKAGRDSYATCLGPTPFCLLKPGRFYAELAEQLSPVGMALSNSSIPHGRKAIATAVFSGLLAFADAPAVKSSLPFGDVEILPSSVYHAWVEQGLRQVNVLHRGFAFRDDIQQRIIHVGDPVVRAVDGVVLYNTSHPSTTLLTKAYIQQLGPAFSMVGKWTGATMAVNVGLQYTLNRILTRRIIALSRRLDTVLPHRIRQYARRKLASLSQ